MTVADVFGQLLLGWLFADFLTGAFHWWEDRHGNESWPVIGQWLIAPNRLHHLRPLAFGAHGFVGRNLTSECIATLTREGFSTLPVIYLQGQMITVREVVRHAALVAGGVHHDSNPREEFHSLVGASRTIQIGGLPFGIRDLMAIARVTIRGLQPLIDDVRRQLDEPAP